MTQNPAPKTHDFTIRGLLPNECDLMAEHLVRQMADSGVNGNLIFNPYEPGDSPSAPALADKRRLRWVKELTEPGWSRAVGAFSGSQLIGHVELDGVPIESGAHRGVLSIGIEPAFRGQGVGKAMSHAALEWARDESPLQWIDLYVFAHNKAARALYRSLGFEEAGSTRDRFRVADQIIDDIHMTLYLKHYRHAKGQSK